MKKQTINIICPLALFAVAAIVLMVACMGSKQSVMSIPIPYVFEGEYSLDGSAWQKLTDDADICALDGDLILRGNFDFDLPAGGILHFYLNHIGVNIYVNGELAYASSFEETYAGADLCGTIWEEWVSTGIEKGDIIEIRLHNPHSYGNGTAYRDFLKSICGGDTVIFEKWIGRHTRIYWITGFFVIVVSLVLLGMALGFKVLHIPNGSVLWSMGVLAAFMGGYILLDTVDISLKNNLVVFNTYLCQICMMLSGFELGMCISKSLNGKAKKMAKAATAVLGLMDGAMFIIVLFGKMLLYDTLPFWAVIQTLVGIILLGCCIAGYRGQSKDERVMSLSFCLILLAMLWELANGYMYWWQSGICVKVVFLLLFAVYLVRAVRIIPQNYLASIETEKLEGELQSSRIVLAMSQIRTHFIFNILNAISGMCKYDPEKADETIVRFARYLRNNIDIMKEDEPVMFLRALEHLEDYVALEQVRFGDKIHFIKEIEAANFKIPPLVLQPLVENAIKHGILVKEEGGTIWLHTERKEQEIVITIRDDGAGFEPAAVCSENSVGIDNVRFRLEHMVNGKLDIKSNPGDGTTVTITLPCKEIM